MAERHLIDQYLSVLRRNLGHLRRTPDLIAEVEDHLLLSIEEKAAAGIDPTTAQSQALQKLGDPRLLAMSLAIGSGAGLALPSLLTRVAAKAAAIGGVGVILTAVQIQVRGLLDPIGSQGATGHLWILGAAAGMAAYFGTVLALVGMFARSGVARAPSSILAVAGTALGLLNMLVSWGRAKSLLLTGFLIAAGLVAAWRWFRTWHGPIWPLVLLPIGPLLELAALLTYRFSTRSISPWQPAFVLFEVGMITFGIALCGSAFLLHRTNATALDHGAEIAIAGRPA